MIPSQTPRNPWTEDATDRAASARATLLRARQAADQVRGQLPDMADALSDFCEDLARIDKIFAASPGAYRQCRAFTTVHLPALISALARLAEMRQQGADTDRLRAISNELTTCLSASRQAREQLESSALLDLEAETATLSSTTQIPSEPPAIAAPATRGLMSKVLGRSVGARLTDGYAAVEKSLSSSADAMTRAGSEIAGRAGAGGGAAFTFVSGLVEDGVDLVTSPVVRHANAAANALSSASFAAILGGAVAAVVFPPAVPLALGFAVLEGGGSYLRTLDDTARQDSDNRAARKSERQAEIDRKLRKLRGETPIVRMETPHVHLALNIEDGSAQGIILSGSYAGQELTGIGLSDLRLLARTAPDEETRKILEAWMARA